MHFLYTFLESIIPNFTALRSHLHDEGKVHRSHCLKIIRDATEIFSKPYYQLTSDRKGAKCHEGLGSCHSCRWFAWSILWLIENFRPWRYSRIEGEIFRWAFLVSKQIFIPWRLCRSRFLLCRNSFASLLFENKFSKRRNNAERKPWMQTNDLVF